MNKKQVERYFAILNKHYSGRCRVILTGAAAAALYGCVRATMDIDFAVRTPQWERFSQAVKKTSLQTGIEAQFAEDIDRWSSITLMDYDKHIYLYKRYENLEVHLMEPSYWAIGKLSRYIDSDIQDLVGVFKKTGTQWRDVCHIAGRALKKSPKSTDCALFRRQTEDFLKNFGKRVWGKRFPYQDAVSLFHKHAGVKGQIRRTPT